MDKKYVCALRKAAHRRILWIKTCQASGATSQIYQETQAVGIHVQLESFRFGRKTGHTYCSAWDDLTILLKGIPRGSGLKMRSNSSHGSWGCWRAWGLKSCFCGSCVMVPHHGRSEGSEKTQWSLMLLLYSEILSLSKLVLYLAQEFSPVHPKIMKASEAHAHFKVAWLPKRMSIISKKVNKRNVIDDKMEVVVHLPALIMKVAEAQHHYLQLPSDGYSLSSANRTESRQYRGQIHLGEIQWKSKCT